VAGKTSWPWLARSAWHPPCRLLHRTVPLFDYRVTEPAFNDPAPPWLLGCWRLMQSDPTLEFGPGVRMEFQLGGHLRYILSVDGRELVVPLLYRTTGDLLETDNPAAPHAMSTRFSRGAGDMLVLDFAGARAIFVRER
jgi:hypothetical protein